jgi:cytochrome c-type biogenesis protein CcmH/NrfF
MAPIYTDTFDAPYVTDAITFDVLTLVATIGLPVLVVVLVGVLVFRYLKRRAGEVGTGDADE